MVRIDEISASKEFVRKLVSGFYPSRNLDYPIYDSVKDDNPHLNTEKSKLFSEFKKIV